MNTNLRKHLQRFTQDQLIDIMCSSLEEMQYYNGQSIEAAIMHAIGADKIDGGWRLPSEDEVIKNTQGASEL